MGRNKHDPVWKSGGGGSFIHSSHWHVWNKKKSITVSFHFNKRRRLWENARAQHHQSNAPRYIQICTRAHIHGIIVSEAEREKSLTRSFPIQSFIYSQAALICGPMDALCVAFINIQYASVCKCTGGYLNFRKCRSATNRCILCSVLFASYGERSRLCTTTEPQFPNRSINFTKFHDSSLCLNTFVNIWRENLYTLCMSRCGLSSKRKAVVAFCPHLGRERSQLVPRFLIVRIET